MADIYGRTGGPFLDQLELEAKEIKSARVEERDPDFSKENMNPLQAQKEQEDAELAEMNKPKGNRITTVEVDFNSVESVSRLMERLADHREKLELEGDTTPSSLLPGVANPTVDSSVTADNVNVAVPTVSTASTVANTDNPETITEPAQTPDNPLGVGVVPSDANVGNRDISGDYPNLTEGVSSDLKVVSDTRSQSQWAGVPDFNVSNSTTPIAHDEHDVADVRNGQDDIGELNVDDNPVTVEDEDEDGSATTTE